MRKKLACVIELIDKLAQLKYKINHVKCNDVLSVVCEGVMIKFRNMTI